jgi:UDP-N-acetylmuramoyl-L-alanyl-D-glutamate--2,6-diaminopimelate ligase
LPPRAWVLATRVEGTLRPNLSLKALLAAAGLGGAELVGARAEPEVTDIVTSTSDVAPGAMFACVPGRRFDGHDFAAEALARGALALLCERPLDLPGAMAAPQVVVPSVRRALGPLAAALWSFPSAAMQVVGVTGTNGKTTTCALLASIFAAGGARPAVIGTLTGARTTPEAPALQRQLARCRDDGVDAVAIEVSSHALDQYRADGTEFAAGVFTNLSQDHLDYHGTMEAYFDAKARLFTAGMVHVAVVNTGDPWGARLAERVARLAPPAPRGGRQRLVEYNPEDAREIEVCRHAVRFTWRGRRYTLAVPARFNVANAVAAAATAAELGYSADALAEGLAGAPPVRGRFELVEEGQPFVAVVDFAHTPAALCEALKAARELSPGGRVIAVFGAGGERDQAKRPLMGKVASELCDVVLVTSDNPRSESAEAIASQVAQGAPGATVELDRRKAIDAAIELARPGDVVVVAGKGHETGQDFGTHVEPFDDVEVLRAGLRRAASRETVAGGRAQ